MAGLPLLTTTEPPEGVGLGVPQRRFDPSLYAPGDLYSLPGILSQEPMPPAPPAIPQMPNLQAFVAPEYQEKEIPKAAWIMHLIQPAIVAAAAAVAAKYGGTEAGLAVGAGGAEGWNKSMQGTLDRRDADQRRLDQQAVQKAGIANQSIGVQNQQAMAGWQAQMAEREGGINRAQQNWRDTQARGFQRENQDVAYRREVENRSAVQAFQAKMAEENRKASMEETKLQAETSRKNAQTAAYAPGVHAGIAKGREGERKQIQQAIDTGDFRAFGVNPESASELAAVMGNRSESYQQADVAGKRNMLKSVLVKRGAVHRMLAQVPEYADMSPPPEAVEQMADILAQQAVPDQVKAGQPGYSRNRTALNENEQDRERKIKDFQGQIDKSAAEVTKATGSYTKTPNPAYGSFAAMWRHRQLDGVPEAKVAADALTFLATSEANAGETRAVVDAAVQNLRQANTREALDAIPILLWAKDNQEAVRKTWRQ